MKALLFSVFGCLALLGGCASMGGPGHRAHGATQHDMHANCPMMGSEQQGGREMRPLDAMQGHGAAHCPMAQDHPDAAAAPHDHAASPSN